MPKDILQDTMYEEMKSILRRTFSAMGLKDRKEQQQYNGGVNGDREGKEERGSTMSEREGKLQDNNKMEDGDEGSADEL